ncbi:hypothetical protein [Paenibacillus sp. PK3_47]|uniref:hypothetical protein n=1 Tax=Paenibacillus sp. PK3_47 TaxID=2072642 RepID=UPI00201DD2E4|nr:hypothetical protein [Paenibacillus sp. PK3_47]
MNNKHGNNEKELAFLQEQLGIVNPSPDQLRQALKELANRKVISKFSIKSDKE